MGRRTLYCTFPFNRPSWLAFITRSEPCKACWLRTGELSKLSCCETVIWPRNWRSFVERKSFVKRHVVSLVRAPSRMVASRSCPLLTVEPTRGLVDEQLRIVVTHLIPNQEVTLHCLHQSEDKDFWEAYGHYVSNEHGTVTGTYSTFLLSRASLSYYPYNPPRTLLLTQLVNAAPKTKLDLNRNN